MKKKTIKQLKADLWKVFSVYIRTRDCLKTTGSIEYGECFTCDEPPQHKFGDLQAGHFVAGRHNANLFSEKGTHAQCRRCNIFLSGNQLEYRRKVVEMYGDGADLELEEEAKQTKKFTLQELEDLIQELKAKIKELEKNGRK